jgi:hypothetical protein
MTDCLPDKDYVTRGLAQGWHKLSIGDNLSYHTLTRLIIVLFKMSMSDPVAGATVKWTSGTKYTRFYGLQYKTVTSK